jgi:CubicO group peptidase (beta-lactamase class C family)
MMNPTGFIRPISAVCALLVLACGVCSSQEKADHSAEVDKIFADLTAPGSPGCALAVARGGKLVYSKGYGLANIEENVPLTPDSVFDIGSTSKQFSASSILLLEQRGKLSVNDDVHKYIPELPDYGKKITILNLLNHTSGLRDYLVLFELAGYNTDSVTTDDEALALVAHQKSLNFDPGSDWLYSNTGYFLLSVIVKRVSGKTLRDFAAENIFQPLDMTHTQYRDSHTALIPNRAMAYDPIDKGKGYTLNVSYFEQAGDGAVHTTVGDLLKWDENFYSGRVGGKPLLDEIQERGHLNSGKQLDYAKGLFLATRRGLPNVSHGGAWGGYRAELLRFPEQHFSVVCLCNRSDGRPSKRAARVADLYLVNLMEPAEAEKKEKDPEEPEHRPAILISQGELAPYAGDYSSDELGVTYRFAMTGGVLKFSGILASGFPRSTEFAEKTLIPVGKDLFEIPDEYVTLTFERDSTGAPSTIVLDAGRTKGMIFRRAASHP